MPITRCTVEEGITPDLVKTAQSRTHGLLKHWAIMDFNMMTLLASCYLQGVRDMSEVIINAEKAKEKHEIIEPPI